MCATRLKPIHCINKSCCYAFFRYGMARIGNDDKLGFGKRTVQVPGAFHRANHVITALNNGGRDMSNRGYFFK